MTAELAATRPLRSSIRRRARYPVSLWVGVTMIGIVVALIIVVPIVSPHDPLRGGGTAALQPPSWRHLFGTDHLGRDVLTRTFVAGRLDVVVALVGVTVPMAVGAVVGAVLGTTRNRWVRLVGETALEAINVFPVLIIVIALVAVLGPGVPSILAALFAVAWARYAKVARGQALTMHRSDLMLAAECLGYSRARVLFRHVIPNLRRVMLAYAISDFVIVVVAIAGLSFLGAGVAPPRPEWGAMMAEGRLAFRVAWWPVLCPGFVLSFLAVGVALLAQGIGARGPGRRS